MEILTSIIGTFNKSFTVKGTASRSEFWYFQLFILMAAIPFAILASPQASMVFFVIILFPGFSLQVRRLHDVGKSGWWILLSFVPFGFVFLTAFYCFKSKAENNHFVERQAEIPQ